MKESKKISKKIYIDLDSLFDTRLSLLELLDTKISLSIYDNRLFYDTRIIDEFDYITKDIFDAFYKVRDNLVFFKAIPTNITELVLTDILYIVNNKYLTDESKSITLIVDTSRYKLNNEQKEKLKIYLQEVFKLPYLQIEVNEFNIMDKSPNYINDEIFSIYKYDGIKWLNEYLQLWNPKELTTNMPSTKLRVPALFDKPLLLKKLSDYIDALNDIVKSVKTVIDLEYVDVHYFNFIDKKHKK